MKDPLNDPARMGLPEAIARLPAGTPQVVRNQLDAIRAADAAWKDYIGKYADAYRAAFDQYQAVLTAEQEHEEKVAEIMFLALTLGGPGGIISVFTKHLQTAAVHSIENFVANHKLQRILRAPTKDSVGEFVLGEALEFTVDATFDAAKQGWLRQWNQAVQPVNPMDPLDLKQRLQGYYTGLFESFWHWVADIIYDKSLTPDRKVQLATKARTAPFIVNAPDGWSLPPSPQRHFLLAFLLKFLLDQDFVEKCNAQWIQYGTEAYAASCQQQPVIALPSYRGVDAITGSQSSSEPYPTDMVHYRALGVKIAELLDKTYSDIYHEEFFKEASTAPRLAPTTGPAVWLNATTEAAFGRQLSHTWLLKAEKTLDRLSLNPRYAG